MDHEMALKHRAQVEEFRRKHRTGLVTLVFTDMAGSTQLKAALGDRAGVALVQTHHALVRELLAGFSEAEEISTAGDSFFIVFVKPSDAVRFSLQLQSRLRALAGTTAHPVQDRIGIHIGEVVIEEREGMPKPKDLYGMQVDLCARVMSLACAEQILLTRSAFDNARQALKGEEVAGLGSLSWLNHGQYLLAGCDEPLEICEVGEAGLAPLKPPADRPQSRRHVSAEQEPVLGWRPAVDQVVPHTKWVLEKKLGEGGFGEVWLGRHQAMKERRVFKFCFRPDRVRSLKREMTLFRLIKERIGDHPNIVSLREVYFDQPPFYVEQDYVAGQDLRAWCESRGPEQAPLGTKLEIVAQIADALQAAHDAGVIHRDVKPANILVTEAEGLQPVAKLADFGIGQVVSEDYLEGITKAGFTQTLVASATSSHSGTQLYMAPELLAGKPASTRSDIYSLGVVLYQLLVGDFTRPVTTDWTADIADPLLREDLRLCFAREPADRFSGAASLARNLRSMPERQARRAAQEQSKRLALRRRVIVRISAAAAAILLLIAGALVYGLHRAKDEALKARRIAYASDMSAAWEARKWSDFGRLKDLLAAQVPAAGQQDFRNWEWRYLWQASRGEQLWTLDCMAESVRGLVLLPGGRLVTGSTGFDESPMLALWDLEQRKAIRTGNLEGNVSGLAISPDRHVLAVAKWGAKVELLAADSLKTISTLVHGKPLWHLAFSPNGKRLSAVGRDELSVWDIATKTRLWSTRCVSELLSAAPFSRDGTQVLCPVDGDSIAFFRAEDGTSVKTNAGLHCSCIALSPDGKWLAGGDWSGSVWVAGLSNSTVHAITKYFGPVTALEFSPDGKHLALGYDDGLIRIMALDSREIVSTRRGHSGTISVLIYSPDGRQLYSGGADGTARVWVAEPSVSNGEVLHSPEIFSKNFSTRNGRFLNDYNPTNRVGRILAFPDLKEIFPLQFPPTNGLYESFALSPTGREWALAARDGNVELWSDAKSPRIIPAHSNVVTALAYSANGNLLASAVPGTEVCVWDCATLRPVLRRSVGLREYAGSVKTLAFSPDNRTLVVPTQDSIFLLNLRSPSEVREITQVGWVESVDISPDGTLLAATSGKEVRIWELGSLRLVARLRGPRTECLLVMFSPDGSRLLASDMAAEICLWDYRIGRLVGRFEAVALSSFAFQPDGDTLVLTHHYGGPRFLRAPPWSEIRAAEKEEQFRREAFRNLPH